VGAAAQPGRAEAFRQIRTNLQFVHIDEPPRSILVTSPDAGEGKTATACNLAVALAQIGVNVILVDGDLRRPHVAEYMGLESSVGLTGALMGWTDWADALQDWGSDDASLRVLTSGQLPPNPSEMLARTQMAQLLGDLENACDVVIVDGPPLLPVADSAVLAAVVSGVVLVVRQGKTRQQQVARAMQSLGSVDARLYGVVLNMNRSGGGSGADNYYGGRRNTAVPPPLVPGPGVRPQSNGAGQVRRRETGRR
jgi:non-specific protein-tyrosine kinase